MGLFDVFSKKEDPIKQIDAIKNDLQQLTEKLGQVSESMNEQVESIRNLPIDQIPEKITEVTHALEAYGEKIDIAVDSINNLNEVEHGSAELKQQAEFSRKNLGALNMVVELELADGNSHLKVWNKFCAKLTKPATDLKELLDQIPGFNREISGLTTRIDDLKKKLGEESH